MKYIGKTCVKCGKTFTLSDDIVVCPDCGSPHHRECYNETKKCACEELHAEGFSWTAPGDASGNDEIPEGMVRCGSCGLLMSDEEEICPHCNEPNEEVIEQKKMYAETDKGFRRIFGVSIDFDMDGVRALDVLMFVKVNVLYYASYFKLIARSKHRLSMNILCLFFPSVYFANRRMWLWAILSSLISVILSIPYAISFLADMSVNTAGVRIFSERVMNLLAESSREIETVISICNGLDFFVRLLFCLFANLIYYKFAVHSVKKLREKAGTDDLPQAELANAGGVRLMNTPLIILMSAAMTMLAVYGSVLLLENFL